MKKTRNLNNSKQNLKKGEFDNLENIDNQEDHGFEPVPEIEQRVFYCPPIELKKKVDVSMFKQFEFDFDFDQEIDELEEYELEEYNLSD